MSALMPLLNPVINIIVERVTDKLLEAIKPREPRYYSRAETAQLLHVTLPTAKKAGGRVLYEAEAIDAAVREQRTFKYKHKN